MSRLTIMAKGTVQHRQLDGTTFGRLQFGIDCSQ